MKLNGKEEIIHFLFNTTIQECRILQEILSISNNSLIYINGLLDMEKCVEFFMHLGKIENLKLKYDDEIIKLFKETLSKYEYEKILINFTNFIDNFNQIKSLHSKISTILKNISDIMNKSKISSKIVEEKKINIEENRKISIKNISNIKEKKEEKKEIREEKDEQIIQTNKKERSIKSKEKKQKIKPIRLEGKKGEIEMELLFNTIIQECHYLKEFVSENDTSLISINELVELEKYAEFFKGLGNLDDSKLKENISKSEYINILNKFNKFIINYGRIKALHSSIIENFIKKGKEFIENTYSILLKNQNIEDFNHEDKNNKINNFINNVNEILSFDKNDPSLKLFLEEEKELFNIMRNYFSKINNDKSVDNEAILKKKNEELSEIINKLKLDLEKEKEIIII